MAETGPSAPWTASVRVEFEDLPNSIRNLVQHLIASRAISRLVLFGSRARGDARENSDYDFAVWLKDRSVWSKVTVDLDDRALSLLPPDLVIYAELPVEYQERIDREGIVLYEAERD